MRKHNRRALKAMLYCQIRSLKIEPEVLTRTIKWISRQKECSQKCTSFPSMRSSISSNRTMSRTSQVPVLAQLTRHRPQKSSYLPKEAAGLQWTKSWTMCTDILSSLSRTRGNLIPYKQCLSTTATLTRISTLLVDLFTTQRYAPSKCFTHNHTNNLMSFPVRGSCPTQTWMSLKLHNPTLWVMLTKTNITCIRRCKQTNSRSNSWETWCFNNSINNQTKQEVRGLHHSRNSKSTTSMRSNKIFIYIWIMEDRHNSFQHCSRKR